jgi:hypothetical protein
VESVWLLLDGGRGAVRRPGLGFLGTSRFAAKTPDYEGWIPLDFLGLSRQNLDLSMGYTRFSVVVVFPSRFCRLETAVEAAAPRFGMRKGRTVHGASLALFPIFSNKMPALAAVSVGRGIAVKRHHGRACPAIHAPPPQHHRHDDKGSGTAGGRPNQQPTR